MADRYVGRRRFLLGTGVLTTAAVLPSAAPLTGGSSANAGNAGRAPAKPNFVMVIADDFGYGQIGVQGQTKIKTPRIDKMAREGLRFTDAYAAAPVCAPARASLLTGLHGGHAPVRRNPPDDGDLPLPPGIPTIATLLQDQGYRTGLFGKWGFGGQMPNPSHPDQHGFTDFYGYLTHYGAKSYYPERLMDGRKWEYLPGNKGDSGPVYGPEVIMDRAMAFLRESKDTPFLLMLTLPLPHAPSAGPPTLGRYAGKDWRRPDRVHAAQITRLDGYVGRLLDGLRANGLDDDTIVIFTGDNGPHEEDGVHPDFFDANGKFRGYKRNLYEGGIRVPFIVRSPKIMARTRGKKTAHPTVHYDLLATFADFVGAAPPGDTDGLSLRTVFEGRGKVPTHPYLYWSRLHAGSTPSQRAEDGGRGRNAAAAVRFGKWKAVGFAPGRGYTTPDAKWRIELYDLAADPGEKKNLAKKRPDLVTKSRGYMRAAWRNP
ncbi:arylsulfatase A-like enzyme [Actinocorallia herbida]|uniref:Arylsulfatase A-like enzyme n=1 Tax=Actinocorallia herbida TaxID=58109 RepID=A0A3N1CUZ2_9ACTN|nr:arylsulfatase [Actinocorallia herbida]ROO85106.1 arylsulfatase A-like enzyme [Actinocorallia herbida]